MQNIALSPTQKERYLRHLMLEDVGEAGQKKLLESSVLIIGAGGLGSPNALYLAAAGVGKIGIIDFDVIDITNLQRQILHTTAEIGRAKVESARAKMQAINPDIEIHTYEERFCAANALKLLQDYDFIIDATDNFAGKYLINDACVLAKKPYSHAGVLKYIGQTMTIIPHSSACLRCVFDTLPPIEQNPDFKAGLFGVLPGITGCIQATEALKFFLGQELLLDTLLTLHTKTMDFNKIKVQKRPTCPTCGENAIQSLSDYPQ